jgi:hypothetical protein
VKRKQKYEEAKLAEATHENCSEKQRAVTEGLFQANLTL